MHFSGQILYTSFERKIRKAKAEQIKLNKCKGRSDLFRPHVPIDSYYLFLRYFLESVDNFFAFKLNINH